MKGMTGVTLLQNLERRLDNVVFRLGLADSRPQARQLVRHGHFRSTGTITMCLPTWLRLETPSRYGLSSRSNSYFKDLADRLGERASA